MLKHADIWRAIDRLAEQNGLSASGLARKAGLSPTVFNPSKRTTGKRKRWPSTESIARILQASGSELDAFVALAGANAAPRAKIPLLGYAEAGQEGYFDDAGYPVGRGWDEIALPAASDPHAFALEINGKSMLPVYREGDRIIVSPAEKPRRGDRVAVRTQKGEVMVKQLGREGAQKLELLSLNPDYPPVTLSRRDVDWMYRVVWASQ
ncbi:MAG: helix-turn-helix transcriptional regulator [Alphaproteobacteria bacterium]|nr:helix-turn-helix transcriptional regulator [Alphaproteobacteria bacterium]